MAAPAEGAGGSLARPDMLPGTTMEGPGAVAAASSGADAALGRPGFLGKVFAGRISGALNQCQERGRRGEDFAPLAALPPANRDLSTAGSPSGDSASWPEAPLDVRSGVRAGPSAACEEPGAGDPASQWGAPAPQSPESGNLCDPPGSECSGSDGSGHVTPGSRASNQSSLKDSTITLSEDAPGQPTRTIIGRSAMPESIALSTIIQCPRDDDGSFLSLGSAKHSAGKCTPCKFALSKRGCKDGVLCKLCHAPHEELTRSGMRRVERRKGLQKRALFENPEGPGRIPASLVKNTFVHVPHAMEVHSAACSQSKEV